MLEFVSFYPIELADYAVYNLNSIQTFRHVLTDKCFEINDPANFETKGNILGNLPPSSQIVQITGLERIAIRKEWIQAILCAKTDGNIFRQHFKFETNRRLISPHL